MNTIPVVSAFPNVTILSRGATTICAISRQSTVACRVSESMSLQKSIFPPLRHHHMYMGERGDSWGYFAEIKFPQIPYRHVHSYGLRWPANVWGKVDKVADIP